MSTAVIKAVAERAGADPDELPPLFDVVDPDALDRLFESMGTIASHRGGTVEFRYVGYQVRVDVGREIDVRVTSSTA